MKEETIQRIRELREFIWPSYYDEDTHREFDEVFFAELKEQGFLVKLKGFGKDGLANEIFTAIAKYGASAAEMAFKTDEGMVEFWEFADDNLRRLLTGKAEILNRRLLTERKDYKEEPIIRLDPTMGFGVGIWRTQENEARWLKAWSGELSAESSARSNRIMLKATDEEWALILRSASLNEMSINDFIIDRVLKNK